MLASSESEFLSKSIFFFNPAMTARCIRRIESDFLDFAKGYAVFSIVLFHLGMRIALPPADQQLFHTGTCHLFNSIWPYRLTCAF
jgi:hypothetical protein